MVWLRHCLRPLLSMARRPAASTAAAAAKPSAAGLDDALQRTRNLGVIAHIDAGKVCVGAVRFFIQWPAM
jgi:hypothetical protein